jgi:hypothetical protein
MIKNLDCDIYIYSNSIPDDIDIFSEFDLLLKKHNKDFAPAPPVENGYVDNFRSCSVFSLKPNDDDSLDLIKDKDELNKRINSLVKTNISDFIQKTGLEINEQEDWEIVRYYESQNIRWHCDNESHPCSVSLVIYINDDYQGGEIEFRDFFPGRKVKAESGSLLIFPSGLNYIHKVNPVTSGVKYALVSFGK